jgi:SAM-dependent methyltransferase
MSEALSTWFTKTSAYDQRPYPIARCGRCRSAFVLPRPQEAYIEEYYSGLNQALVREHGRLSGDELLRNALREEENYPNATVDAARIAAQCVRLTSGRELLDVGAGYGFFSRAALSEGFNVTAIEPTAKCREVFHLMNGFEPSPGMLTRQFAAANIGRFDVLLMSQVLEHIADLESVLSYAAAVLRRGGVAAIAVPHFRSLVSRLQGKNDMFIAPPEHLNYFTILGLRALFSRHSFNCVTVYTVSRFNVSRVARKIPVPPALGTPIAFCISAAVKLSDYVQAGMYINAFFRKHTP